MGETTAIAWTDKTWNPWQGCHKVSPACTNCYMYREKKRYGQDPATVVRSKQPTFNAPLKWRDPAKVFTCSWSDFFIEEADAWRDEAWEIIRRTPHLTYQILTKRPGRALHLWPDDPPQNVWLGVTAESQKLADERIPLLLATPAAVRFVSIEPMLGPVRLREIQLPPSYNLSPTTPAHVDALSRYDDDHYYNVHEALDWVICGCESGPRARETRIEWVRQLMNQCASAGVPFFLKQLWVDGQLVTLPEMDGQRWAQMPEVRP